MRVNRKKHWKSLEPENYMYCDNVFAHIGCRLQYHNAFCTVTNLRQSNRGTVVYLSFDNAAGKSRMDGWYSVLALEGDDEVKLQTTIPIVVE